MRRAAPPPPPEEKWTLRQTFLFVVIATSGHWLALAALAWLIILTIRSFS